MNHSPKAIFFDLFATLISVSKAAGGQGRYTADILGIDRSRWSAACFSEHHEICRPTNQAEIIQKMAHSLDPDIPIPLIHEATEERQWRFDHALINIEQEILEVLEGLKSGGIRLGLISNASTDEVRAWSNSPLAPLFETALFSCDCGLKKPEPEIYQLALNSMAVSAGQSLFVGDGNSREHQGAAASGIRSLLVTYFIEGCSEGELKSRGKGSAGTISHIRELLSSN
ncbi:MAG: HAD family hydrolase [Candidatus Sedimenticola sp. (ex Thyasira tokunagai)]